MDESNYAEFAAAMAHCATATRSDLTEDDYTTYFGFFEKWPIDDFIVSMGRCAQEIPKFPTVSQVRELRPKKRTTIDDIEGSGHKNYQPMLTASESASDRGSDELEARIDALADAELFEIFVEGCEYRRKPTMDSDQVQSSGDYLVRQFRKQPQSVLYRGFVRDELNGG